MDAYELQLASLGYIDAEGNTLPNVDGLTNVGAERFRFLGYSGYPDVPCAALAEIPGVSVLVWCETAPTGGVLKTPEQALALLKGPYGWPEGTTLVDGLPVRPEGAL